MKSFDARDWSPDIKRQIETAATRGMGKFELSDNLRVVVVDEELWEALAKRLPNFIDTLKALHSSDPGDL